MREQVIATIAKHLGNEGVRTEISDETQFDTMNVDSLSLYSMIAGVEDEYDIIVPCADFTCTESVGDLADKIMERLPSPVAKAA